MRKTTWKGSKQGTEEKRKEHTEQRKARETKEARRGAQDARQGNEGRYPQQKWKKKKARAESNLLGGRKRLRKEAGKQETRKEGKGHSEDHE